jgi:uncharacterized damage-inducible protein DinB
MDPRGNDVLQDTVRHHTWANQRLVASCREAELTEEQLTAPGTGTFGGILATLEHIVTCDAAYLRRLFGTAPSPRDENPDLAGLERRAQDNEKLWERLLAGPIDVERMIVVDEGALEVRAGIFLAQAFDHASHHRAQVCAMLRSHSIQPPDLQAWEYAWTKGHIRKRDG